MAVNKKITLSEKEKQLLEKIEQAKNELKSLKDKRKLELGELAYKHGLADLDNTLLSTLFGALAKEHTSNVIASSNACA